MIVMEKTRINFDAFNYKSETDVRVNDDTVIRTKEMIPCDEKERFVFSLAEATLVVDEDTGITYKSYLYDVVYAFLFAKFYTNIDVSELDNEEGHKKLFDYMSNVGLIEAAITNNSRLVNELNSIDKMYS